jgi:hypothetical protein
MAQSALPSGETDPTFHRPIVDRFETVGLKYFLEASRLQSHPLGYIPFLSAQCARDLLISGINVIELHTAFGWILLVLAFPRLILSTFVTVISIPVILDDLVISTLNLGTF